MPRIYVYDNDHSVLLNEAHLADCIWANEETGEAEVYEHEWHIENRGARVVDASHPCGYRTMLVKGDIRIIRNESPEPQPFDYTGCGEMGWCPC